MTSSDTVGEEVAAWLRRSLYDEMGKRRMTDAGCLRRSKVSRGTFYAILGGKVARPDQATLNRLARALGVPAPRIERRFTIEPSPAPETPLAMLRAAQAILDRLAERLKAES